MLLEELISTALPMLTTPSRRGFSIITSDSHTPSTRLTHSSLVLIDRGVSKGSHFVSNLLETYVEFVQVECQLQGEAGTTSNPFKMLGMWVLFVLRHDAG